MKKRFIITLVVVIVLVLIVGIIAIGIGLYHDFKQESELISECEQIKELTNEENLDTEKINEMLTRRISDGEYLQVEEALKEYLTARFQNITKISEILNIKETTIQTRLMRARAKIKSMVKGDWLDE